VHSPGKPLKWSHVSFLMGKHIPLKSWTSALTNLKVVNFRKIGDISFVRNFAKNGQEKIMLICDYSHGDSQFTLLYIWSMFGVQLRGRGTKVFPVQLRWNKCTRQLLLGQNL
jgi:hypothetical protein